MTNPSEHEIMLKKEKREISKPAICTFLWSSLTHQIELIIQFSSICNLFSLFMGSISSLCHHYRLVG